VPSDNGIDLHCHPAAAQRDDGKERKRKPAIVLQMLPTHVPAVPSSPHGVNVSLSDAGQSALVGLRVGLPLEQQE
jgi:hypothetical protein